MADANSILASLEDACKAVLAIESVCNAAQGECPPIGDLRADLAFGVAVMAGHAVERLEVVKTMVREVRDGS